MGKEMNNIKKIIKNHIINNKREYLIVVLIFIIGIFLGVLFVNNMQETVKTDMTNYFNSFIEKMKSAEKIDNMDLVQNSIIQNTILAIVIWFFGTTVIGLPVVFGIILYRGFCLGYTISICVGIMGISKGIIFIIISLLIQNILFIPAILALAVSGFKLYKSIVKDNRKENIKLEIIRHTIFSLVMLVILILSSVLEVVISTNNLKYLIKYF